MMTAIAFPAKMTLVHARALLMAVTKSQNWQAGPVLLKVTCFSKIQLVVYYQCCVLIG